VTEPPQLHAAALLRRLAAADVDFVVIGGVAVIAHGHVRVTKDLDISYATDPANLERLAGVLQSIDARLSGLSEEVPFVADARMLRGTSVLTLDTTEGRLDLLASPDGAPPYRQLAERAETVDFGDVRVRVTSLDDLIAMKRAAGRLQDQADLQVLETILRLRG
jgi:predicted nucleotidyltransferase